MIKTHYYLSIILFAVSSYLSAHTHTIRNYTAEEVALRVDTIAGYDIERTIKPPYPGDQYNEVLIDTGIRCTRAFEAATRFGILRVEVEDFNKCQSFEVAVHYKNIANPDEGITLTIR